jgi:hypothetical protein
MSDPKPFRQEKRDFIRDYLTRVLTYAKGRTGGASRVAGMSAANFCKLLRIHGIKAKDFR